ncbi:hypothetical protein PQR70_26090 [Paraburkholderia madseniana]|uniref:hypothetical protein n=1 Tax=Paraburkholderia madseniana TaxID=2599607 RepID=UPI0038B9E4CD
MMVSQATSLLKKSDAFSTGRVPMFRRNAAQSVHGWTLFTACARRSIENTYLERVQKTMDFWTSCTTMVAAPRYTHIAVQL